jgi:hypothetical protein
MAREGRHCGVDVTRSAGRDEGAMDLVRLAPDLRVPPLCLGYVERRGFLQTLQDARQVPAAALLVEEDVEAEIEIDPAREVRLFVHLVGQGLGLTQLLIADVEDRQLHGQWPQPLLNLVDLLDLAPVELSHHPAAIPVERDQPFSGEIAQGLSDGRRADAQLSGEIGLNQPAAAGKIAPEDSSPQGLMREVLSRPPVPDVRQDLRVGDTPGIPAPVRAFASVRDCRPLVWGAPSSSWHPSDCRT